MLVVTFPPLCYRAISPCAGTLAAELLEKEQLQWGGWAMRTQAHICINWEKQSEELPHPGEPVDFLPIFFPSPAEEMEGETSHSWLFLITSLFFSIQLTSSSLLLSSTIRHILWEIWVFCVTVLVRECFRWQPVAACARKEIFLSETYFSPLDQDALRGRNMHRSALRTAEFCCQSQH